MSNIVIVGADQGIGYYPYQTLYELGKNNGTEAGMYFTSISNPDIMWETQVSTDAAVEFGFWDNKLSGSIEYFRKESKDLLFDVVVYPNGNLRVLDCDEAAEAKEKGLITEAQLLRGLRSMNELLYTIYHGRFDRLQAVVEGAITES